MTSSIAARSSIASRADRERGALRAFLLLAIVPNLVLRAAEFALRGSATLVNVEFLAIALAAPFFGTGLTITVLAVAVAADATVFIAPIFHFELGAVIPSLAELASARPLFFVALALVIAVVDGFGARALVRAAPRELLRDWRVRGALLGGIVLLVGADIANGSGSAISTRLTFLPVNIAGAPTFQLAIGALRAARDARAPRRAVVPVASATGALMRDVAGAPPNASSLPNVALVIVESMGQLRDHRADTALFAALLDTAIAGRYEIRRGTVPFDGPTTGGEFRELCGQLRTYRSAPSEPLPTCLPARLRARGYTTIALHGFRRGLFDRKSWYPRIGFDSIVDDAVIRAAGDVPLCGSIFRGPCDAAVGPVFTHLLQVPAGSRRFVYWLTLSAHFPADSHAAEGSSFDCRIWAPLAEDESACMLARIWSRDLAAVRATALASGLPPTRFVIVGDHAPPLPTERLGRLFNDRVVPWVELVPRPSSLPTPSPNHASRK